MGGTEVYRQRKNLLSGDCGEEGGSVGRTGVRKALRSPRPCLLVWEMGSESREDRGDMREMLEAASHLQ